MNNFGTEPGEGFYEYISRVEDLFEEKIKREPTSEVLVGIIADIFEHSVLVKPEYLKEVNRLIESKGVKVPNTQHLQNLVSFLRHRLLQKLHPQLRLPQHLKYLENEQYNRSTDRTEGTTETPSGT